MQYLFFSQMIILTVGLLLMNFLFCLFLVPIICFDLIYDVLLLALANRRILEFRISSH